MLLTGRNPDHVPLMDLFNGITPALYAPNSRRHDQDLTERVRVPGRTCTRLERYESSPGVRRSRRLEQGINTRGTGEMLGGRLSRLL